MESILNYLKAFPWQRAVSALCIAIICLIVTKIILTIINRIMSKSKLDPLAIKILRVTAKIFLLFTSVIIVLSYLGISVTSFVAAFSLVGVAFSLAIQDFLTNVFGGLQIITNKPFKVGDYVDAASQSGTIVEVGLFYTKMTTPDKKLIQIPNSKIATDSVVNYSCEPKRRVDFSVSVSYDSDVEKVRTILAKLMKSHPLVLSEESFEPVVHVKEFRDNDVCYTARCWCNNADYWTVYFDIMDVLKPALEKNGIEFSYPHVNVHMIEN